MFVRGINSIPLTLIPLTEKFLFHLCVFAPLRLCVNCLFPIQMITIKPNFGVNYDIGYVGFTSHSDDLVDAGISWFERWQTAGSQMPEARGQTAEVRPPTADLRPLTSGLRPPASVCVSHTFIVSGSDECIEAHAKVGVHKGTLSQYFNDPHCRVFFRKPVGWTLPRGHAIDLSAAVHIGDKYGYGVIIADALANTCLGHWLNCELNNWPNRIVSRLFDRAGAEVCSELVAMALQDQDWLMGTGARTAMSAIAVGCLSQPARMITPQMLFEDTEIFCAQGRDSAPALSPPAQQRAEQSVPNVQNESVAPPDAALQPGRDGAPAQSPPAQQRAEQSVPNAQSIPVAPQARRPYQGSITTRTDQYL